MLRPVSKLGLRISLDKQPKEFIRNKVVRPASILKPAEKIKLYNKENKELFGPLLETAKEKNKRLHKLAKNKISAQHNSSSDDSGNAAKFVKNSLHKYDELKGVVYAKPMQELGILRSKMWQKTKNCVNFVGALCNQNVVRGIQTTASSSSRSSAAQAGYASEDKILQIKQFQTDYTQQYPSVTLILNKTMTDSSRSALDKWKQQQIEEMGKEQFEKFYQAQMAVGTKLHSTIKNYFTQPVSQLRIEKDVEGVWNSVSDVLKNVSSPKAIESNVVHPVLKYRGIFDAIADYEDKPTLIEWKKSDKARKSIAMTYDNPVQLAAYFGAVANDLNYKHLNVRDALLVIAYTDGSKADCYHFSIEKLREHWAQWLIRLEQYTNKYSNNEEKKLVGGKRLFEEDIDHL